MALPVQTIGVLADTHIPDRARELHPALIPAFQAAGVNHILHAGDISIHSVLDQLARVAPVTAVRGNRDLLVKGIPMVAQVNVGGVTIALLHGHGGFVKYLEDKVKYLLYGYDLHRYLDLLTQSVPEAKVVVFGHTHHPEIFRYKGKLLFNPGSASFGYYRHRPPTAGLIRIYPDGRAKAEFLFLEGYQLKKRQWVEYQEKA